MGIATLSGMPIDEAEKQAIYAWGEVVSKLKAESNAHREKCDVCWNARILLNTPEHEGKCYQDFCRNHPDSRGQMQKWGKEHPDIVRLLNGITEQMCSKKDF